MGMIAHVPLSQSQLSSIDPFTSLASHTISHVSLFRCSWARLGSASLIRASTCITYPPCAPSSIFTVSAPPPPPPPPHLQPDIISSLTHIHNFHVHNSTASLPSS